MTAAWRGAVEIDARERAARHWLPLRAPIASVWVSPHGDAVRVQPDGSCAPLLAPGHPRAGIASDPCATRRAA